MSEFEQFLVDRGLTALEVSLRACTRYLTVWKATKGHPISQEQAKRIRDATYSLTGVRYIGALVVYHEVDKISTVPVKHVVFQ